MSGLIRKQHPGFGKEIRALLTSTKRKDRVIAGILVSEIDELLARKEQGEPHAKEDCLQGDLSSVRYLRLYVARESSRVYFTVRASTIWMLHLDTKKRRTQVAASTKDLLKQRVRQIEETLAQKA